MKIYDNHSSNLKDGLQSQRKEIALNMEQGQKGMERTEKC